MHKDSTSPKPIYQVASLLRRHWLVAICLASAGAILWFGAPAWAAPVTRPHYQTVPRPTPVENENPIATATPRPDDSEGDSSTGTPQDQPTVDPNAPNITFPQGPDDQGSAGAPNNQYTAVVTVNGLNLREGPGTNFNTLGSLPANTQVTVLSRNEDNTWWYVCCLANNTTNGWASAQLLTPNFDATQAAALPLFGSTPPTPAAATPQPAAQNQTQAARPLSVDFFLEPYFVWQGITATLTITVNNPNNVDAVNVLLSDELPAGLTLISAEADAGGTVETANTAEGRPLLLFRWNTLPADTGATATIVALVDADLSDGAVIDNLVATRARNVTYSTSAVTIGLPPIVPPDFQ